MDTVAMAKERNRWDSFYAVSEISKIRLKESLLTVMEAISCPDYKVCHAAQLPNHGWSGLPVRALLSKVEIKKAKGLLSHNGCYKAAYEQKTGNILPPDAFNWFAGVGS